MNRWLSEKMKYTFFVQILLDLSCVFVCHDIYLFIYLFKEKEVELEVRLLRRLGKYGGFGVRKECGQTIMHEKSK